MKGFLYIDYYYCIGVFAYLVPLNFLSVESITQQLYNIYIITIDSNLWLLNLLQKRLFYKNFRNKEKTWTTIILLLPSSKKGWLNNNRKIRSGSIFIIVHVVLSNR